MMCEIAKFTTEEDRTRQADEDATSNRRTTVDHRFGSSDMREGKTSKRQSNRAVFQHRGIWMQFTSPMWSHEVMDSSRSPTSVHTPEEEIKYSTWTQAPTTSQSSAGIFVAVVVSIGMFIFGTMLGLVLHAIVYPKSGPQLALANSTLCRLDDVSSQARRPCDRPSHPNNHYKKVETTTTVVYHLTEKESCSGFPWRNIRLPRDVAPSSYNITIHPNITTRNMTGSVAIDIKVLKATKLIILHYKDLVLTKFSIVVNSKRREAEHRICPKLSQWAFVLENRLVPGDVVEMGIEFHGQVREDLHGLYISTHTDEYGNQSRSAVTQFEATHAAEMFPCFDEPNFKATFELSVIRDAQYVVRSNMAMKVSKEYSGGLYMDVFHRTVKMSTYLLAVAILDRYDYVRGMTKDTHQPIEVRLYAPQDVLGYSEFGLDVGIRSLEFFEKYLHIPYQLDKIDLVSVDNFRAGAMENWGMMTFIESSLIYVKGEKTDEEKERVAMTICHEVAHQWFGNLVTMDWWDDLWLNEGFAKYMEFRCIDNLYPDWNIMTQFYTKNVVRSHEEDGQPNPRSVSSHSLDIRLLFDVMSYQKGSAIIRMIESLVGERKFVRALIEYLNKYAYANTHGSQLWDIVEKYVVLPHGISLHDVVNAYIKQAGCPEIFVTLSNMEITVHNQTRYFFYDGMRDNTRWTIPIHYRTDSQPESRLQWLKASQNKVSWPLMKSSKWVVANTESLSYVKVLYDAKNYAELAKQLRTDHTAISVVDRTMILTDAFDFAKSSKVNIEAYLNLLLYASEETDYPVWKMISKQMKYIEKLIEETPFAHIFRDLQRTLVLRPYERIGWSTNTSMTPAQTRLQAELIRTACRLRIPHCIKQAQLRFNQWITEGKRPSPDLFDVILNEGIHQGGRAAWINTYRAFDEAITWEKKIQLLSAMASTTRSTLISRMLRLCLDGSIRSKMVPFIVWNLAHTSASRALTWRFFRVNYKHFVELLGKDSRRLRITIGVIIEEMSSQEDLEEVKAFLRDKQLEHSKESLSGAFKQIELNIQWRRLNEEPIRRWLYEWDANRRRKHHYRHHHQ